MAKYVLFSPVSGKVVVAGKPQGGVTVKRWYKGGYSGKEATDTTQTDASGQFSFPVVTFSSIMAGIVPHEPVITQRMFVVVDGQDVQVYGTVKHDYELNGELGGLPLNFVLDPKAEVRQVGSELTPVSIRSPNNP